MQSSWGNENCYGTLKYSERICPIATLYTTFFTLLELRSMLGCHVGILGVKCLSPAIHGILGVMNLVSHAKILMLESMKIQQIFVHVL